MEVIYHKQFGPELYIKLKLFLEMHNRSYYKINKSPKFEINGSTMFQLESRASFHRNTGVTPTTMCSGLIFGNYTPDFTERNELLSLNNSLFITFNKIHEEDDLSYSMELRSTQIKLMSQFFHTDFGKHHLIHESSEKDFVRDSHISCFEFDLIATVLVHHSPTFATIYDDTSLTDFELRGVDGSVKIHRAMLAASSPVLKRMFEKTWKETVEGFVQLPGTSKKTLQQMKDYIYLHILPDDGLEKLILLAAYYMMPVLEQKCVDKLASDINADNVCNLLKFAVRHDLSRLILTILESIENGSVKVTEIKKNFLLAEKKLQKTEQ